MSWIYSEAGEKLIWAEGHPPRHRLTCDETKQKKVVTITTGYRFHGPGMAYWGGIRFFLDSQIELAYILTRERTRALAPHQPNTSFFSRRPSPSE